MYYSPQASYLDSLWQPAMLKANAVVIVSDDEDDNGAGAAEKAKQTGSIARRVYKIICDTVMDMTILVFPGVGSKRKLENVDLDSTGQLRYPVKPELFGDSSNQLERARVLLVNITHDSILLGSSVPRKASIMLTSPSLELMKLIHSMFGTGRFPFQPCFGGYTYQTDLEGILGNVYLNDMHVELIMRRLFDIDSEVYPLPRVLRDEQIISGGVCSSPTYLFQLLVTQDKMSKLKLIRDWVKLLDPNWIELRFPVCFASHWVSFRVSKEEECFQIIDSLSEKAGRKRMSLKHLRTVVHAISVSFPDFCYGWKYEYQATGTQRGNDCALHTAVYCAGYDPSEYIQTRFKHLRLWLWWTIVSNNFKA